MGRDLEAGTPPGYSRLDSSGWHLAAEAGGVAMQVSWVPAAFLSALFCFYLGCSQDCLRRWPFWSSRRDVGVATPKRKSGGGLWGDPGLGLTYSVPLLVARPRETHCGFSGLSMCSVTQSCLTC